MNSRNIRKYLETYHGLTTIRTQSKQLTMKHCHKKTATAYYFSRLLSPGYTQALDAYVARLIM